MGPLELYQGTEKMLNLDLFLEKFGLSLEKVNSIFFSLFLNSVLLSINIILIYILIKLIKSFNK